MIVYQHLANILWVKVRFLFGKWRGRFFMGEGVVLHSNQKKSSKNQYETKRFHLYLQPKGFLLHMRRDVFQAIADPTRREIINLIAYKALNINSVSDHFEVSRAAIYKHIKILTECGLLEVKQKGRERYCEARLEKLDEVTTWVEQYRKTWNDRLDNLEEYLNNLQNK